MIPDGLDLQRWTTAVIGLAVAGTLLRLWLRRRGAAAEAQGPVWRFALLLLLQPLAGLFLHLVLFPPGGLIRTGVLTVLTGPVARAPEGRPGDVLIALPEAGVVKGASPAPDLATALRRYPDAARVRVIGPGLPLRDQAPVPLPVIFDPPPPPRGLIDLTLPEPLVPGGVFLVGGQVGSLPAGSVELLDPAGAVVDRAPVAAGQRFELRAGARATGLALFAIRLRDAAGAVVEEISAPVETRAQTQPRVLVLAGAAEPETKFLRRWAQDSAITLNVQIEVGGGVQLGDPPIALIPAALSRFDLLVVDDRRWDTLDSAAKAAVRAAVESGMGLLLRPTGPLSEAARRDWAALGLRLADDGGVRPTHLASAAPRPPDAAEGAAGEPEALPELQRRDLVHTGLESISLLKDASGEALASWRPRGRGRVGVWTVTDTYALVLTGRSDLYGEVWSELLSALARPVEGGRLRVNGLPRAGMRAVVCGLSGEARVVGPDGGERVLTVDPATGQHGCAAFWPDTAGWTLLRHGRDRETFVYVHAREAGPSLLAADIRWGTLAMTEAPSRRSAGAAPARRAPGSPWPWFVLLCATLTALWWLERKGKSADLPGPKPKSVRRRPALA